MAYLYKRDAGKCHLCGKHISLKLAHPHPMSCVVDHIIPMARGGTGLASNLHVAHKVCNERKHINPSKEQLLLLG